MIVDAGVLLVALSDDGPDGDVVRRRLHGETLVAPHLVDLELLSAWRRLHRVGQLDDRRVALAVDDLRALPLRRVTHLPFLDRCWDLRHNVTPYDAAYVAVAEAFGDVLLTADVRLANAPGIRCDVEVLSAA